VPALLPETPSPRQSPGFEIARTVVVMFVGLLVVIVGLELHWHGAIALPSRDRLVLAEKAYRYGNDHEAARLFGRLAKNGNATAQYWLAHMTELGLGVPRNPPRAIKLYQEAAKQNLVMAEIRLGEIYLYGDLTPPNPELAKKYLDDAAYDGNARAAMLLGQLYRHGIGVSHNLAKADAWLEVAALEGSKFAERERGVSFRDLSIADQKDVITRTRAILKTIKETVALLTRGNHPEKGSNTALKSGHNPRHVA
jgi:TPR repeat protein